MGDFGGKSWILDTGPQYRTVFLPPKQKRLTQSSSFIIHPTTRANVAKQIQTGNHLKSGWVPFYPRRILPFEPNFPSLMPCLGVALYADAVLPASAEKNRKRPRVALSGNRGPGVFRGGNEAFLVCTFTSTWSAGPGNLDSCSS